MRFCMDDNIGIDMKELERIIQADELCSKEEAWKKLMGTGAEWKSGMQYHRQKSITSEIFLIY